MTRTLLTGIFCSFLSTVLHFDSNIKILWDILIFYYFGCGNVNWLLLIVDIC